MDTGNNHGSLLGAIAEYTETLDQNPRSPVFVQLSEAYRQLGMADDALIVARTGVNSLPAYPPGHILLGRLFAERNDTAAAIVSFTSALALDDASLPALKGLARIYYQQGDHAAARPLLLRAAELNPGDAVVRKALASLAPVKVESRPGAADNSSMTQKAEAPIATPTIAEIYERQGFTQRALGVYRDLLQKDPTNQELVRKYRELQERTAGTGVVPPLAVECAAQVEDTFQAVVTPPSLPTGHLVIHSLERLLEAVRRRRAHV